MALRTNTIEYAFTSLNTSTKTTFDSFFVWDGSVFTDETTDAGSTTTNDVTLSGTLNSIYYFGLDNRFTGIKLLMQTNGTNGVLDYEYSTGSGNWSALTLATVRQGSKNLTGASGAHIVTFDIPTDWATDTVNSATRYWVRAKVTTGYTVTPVGSWFVAGGGKDFAQLTAYIPETSSRTFRSVMLEVSTRDRATTSNGAMWAMQSIVKVGSGTPSRHRLEYASGTNSLFAGSFAPVSPITMFDITSNFASNFGNGTSQTIDVFFSGLMEQVDGSNGYTNLTAKLIITYEYDDASVTTRIKTVKIPLESPTSILSASLVEIGTDQVPNLDTFLPEASKTYRDIYFQVEGNENRDSATDWQLCLALDSEAEHQDDVHDNNITNPAFYRYLWKRTDMATNATHKFKARSTVANRMRYPCIVLVVTYEYNESTTTSVLNSIQLPWNSEAPIALSTDTATDVVFNFPIQEPGTITLKQSGVHVAYKGLPNILNARIKVGSQALKTYSFNASGCNTYYGYIHRIDSGGSQGAAFTPARGIENKVTMQLDRSATDVEPFMTDGILYLNYTSDKHSSGTAAHNHTTRWVISPTVFNLSVFTGVKFDATSIVIPESNYYIGNSALAICQYSSLSRPTSSVCIEIKNGEFNNAGWLKIPDIIPLGSGNTRQYVTYYSNTSGLYKKYPTQPSSNFLDIENSRKYKMVVSTDSSHMYFHQYVTYHSITYTASGTVSGYTGDGSGISVELHRKDTDELVGRVTTSAGGGYTLTWYDNTVELYGHARQDGTHLGGSDDTLAS